ncbi:GvpL/GvpF family gas vesicle protein [Spartinivicinus ruber]|uniref:GvpL/GvpF family gas vesicle protein n=1 Tax=Spartinivicinus ruber TaxID=2683272 RepID=UPI0013D350F6|nr:GvpL/GvpF family gas vesicle protein [Spartinivicinus ruber]
MKCLLYCLFHNLQGADVLVALPEGVEGNKVFLVGHHDIFGAYSFYSDNPVQQTSSLVKKINNYHPEHSEGQAIHDALVFNQIIEILHQHYALIPMRFGCCFNSEQEVVTHLKHYYQKYLQKLTALANFTELSIKVILPVSIINGIADVDIVNGKHFLVKNNFATDGQYAKGGAYLLERRAHYNQTVNDAVVNHLVADINSAFHGLYSEYCWETKSQAGQQVLSIYYLVAKELIESFNIVFQHLNTEPNSCKLLLSGPWAPYNFVTDSAS